MSAVTNIGNSTANINTDMVLPTVQPKNDRKDNNELRWS